jgi:hypothetical protein
VTWKVLVPNEHLRNEFIKPFKILRIRINVTGKRHLESHRNRWKANIKMDLKKIDVNMRNWVDSSQDRDYWKALVNAASNHKPWS